MVFSQDTQYLLAGGFDQKIYIWTMKDLQQVHIFETDNEIQKIIISPDNKYISCITGLTGTIYIWDFQQKQKLIQERNSHQKGYSLCSSADSQIYVSSGTTGPIIIWKLNLLQNNKYSLTFIKLIMAGSRKVLPLLTMDEQYIIWICNQDGKIMVYERESEQMIQELDFGEKSHYDQSISISNDMKLLVSKNFTKNIKVWIRE